MTTPAPREYIPLSVQRRNLLYIVLDGMAIGLMSAAGTFVSVLVIRLGASPVWVSLLSSLPNAVGLGMTLPWSRFAERQARPQVLFAWSRLAVHLVYPMVALVPFVLTWHASAQVIVVVWSLSAFPSSLSNLMFTIVMGHAATPERRAFQMSRRWMFMGVANMVLLPLASLLIGRTTFPRGYQILYAANFAIALFAFYCAQHIQVERRTRQVAPTPSKLPLARQHPPRDCRSAQRETFPDLHRRKSDVQSRAVHGLGAHSDLLAQAPESLRLMGRLLFHLCGRGDADLVRAMGAHQA